MPIYCDSNFQTKSGLPDEVKKRSNFYTNYYLKKKNIIIIIRPLPEIEHFR